MSEMSKSLSFEERADRSIFPNPITYYYEYSKYSTTVNGDFGGTLMTEAMVKLRQEFPKAEIYFQEKTLDYEMQIIILTDFMRNVLNSMPQAAEIIFMDSTSHVDLMNCTVTLMLTRCPAGSVPIGSLITKSQTEQSYTLIR